MADYIKPNSKVNTVKDIYSDLDMFLVPHPVTGDISTKKDSDAIKRSIRNIVLTNKFERPFKPNFGGGVTSMLFELDSTRKVKRFQKEMVNMIERLEPRVYNVSVRLNPLTDDNRLDVQIFYSIRNGKSGQSAEFTVTRVR
jgi:phage baseplate assembly protein W|tara:strand:+ start:441 stop:863 length:423 start_codon:yes stop_codon:yes gene_type:complete